MKSCLCTGSRLCWVAVALLVGCSGSKTVSGGDGAAGGQAANAGAPVASAGTSASGSGGSGTMIGSPAGRGGGGGSGGGGGFTTSAGAGGSAKSAAGSSGAAAGGTGGMGGSAGAAPGTAGAGGRGGNACAPAASPLVGWASQSGNGVTSTTGGEGGATMSVDSLTALQNAVKGTTAQIIEISGSIAGDIAIGSNKTLIGCGGAQLKGKISLNGSANVIVRNLTIVGYNCTDNPSDCSGGADAVGVQGGAHHLWFDHDDISDGSDGNLDITHASDFITISWTKFHYSGRRTDPAGAAGGHQFSDLIGHSDSNASEDTGHLRITFHHDWWADNVVERMPRVRFGKVHIFDNLYTSTGNDYCIGVGYGADILTENNVFIGVAVPINTTSYSDSASKIRSSGNLYTNTSGAAPADLSASSVFTPPYTYSADATAGLEATIRAGAGPQ